MLAYPFNWRVRWPRPARVPLFSLGQGTSKSMWPQREGRGWLTRYRPREVRNSIYRYRKIHIDYRSKFLYRFISPISIIYGNTSWLYYVYSAAILWQMHLTSILMLWSPSIMWAGPLIFLSTTTGDVWIIPSFQIWGYMLHVKHISCHHELWTASVSHPSSSLNS